MTGLMQHLLSTPAVVVYVVVGSLVFAEDALFIGFVLPGETAAILGGVDASRHRVNLWIVLVVGVAAEIVGDSVGYQIGGGSVHASSICGFCGGTAPASMTPVSCSRAGVAGRCSSVDRLRSSAP